METLENTGKRRDVLKWMAASIVGGVVFGRVEVSKALSNPATDASVTQLMMIFKSAECFRNNLKDFGSSVQKSFRPGSLINGVDVTTAQFASSLQSAIDQILPELESEYLAQLRNHYADHYSSQELQEMIEFFGSSTGKKVVFELTNSQSEVGKLSKVWLKKLNDFVLAQITQGETFKLS